MWQYKKKYHVFKVVIDLTLTFTLFPFFITLSQMFGVFKNLCFKYVRMH